MFIYLHDGIPTLPFSWTLFSARGLQISPLQFFFPYIIKKKKKPPWARPSSRPAWRAVVRTRTGSSTHFASCSTHSFLVSFIIRWPCFYIYKIKCIKTCRYPILITKLYIENTLRMMLWTSKRPFIDSLNSHYHKTEYLRNKNPKGNRKHCQRNYS